VGLTTLESLTEFPETEVAALHGVGPIALERLRSALTQAKLAFAHP